MHSFLLEASMGSRESFQRCLYAVYLGLTLLSTHYIGYVTTGSVKGRGNQYVLLDLDPAL